MCDYPIFSDEFSIVQTLLACFIFRTVQSEGETKPKGLFYFAHDKTVFKVSYGGSGEGDSFIQYLPFLGVYLVFIAFTSIVCLYFNH